MLLFSCYEFITQFSPLPYLYTCSTTQRDGRGFVTNIERELKCVSLCVSFVEVDLFLWVDISSIRFSFFPSRKQQQQQQNILRYVFPNDVTKGYLSVLIVQFISDVDISESTAMQFFRPVVLSYFWHSVQKEKKIYNDENRSAACRQEVKIFICMYICPYFFPYPVSFVFVPFAVQQMRNSAGTTKVIFPLKRCLYILFCCSIVCFPPPAHIADCTHYSVSGHCERHACPPHPSSSCTRNTAVQKCANNAKTLTAAVAAEERDWRGRENVTREVKVKPECPIILSI